MSEQAKIIEDIQKLVMSILKTGIATAEEGSKLDELEVLLYKQRCFKSSTLPEYDCLGEEIVALFLNDNFTEAVDKLYEYKISSEDFFGFVEYHYDEDEEDNQEIIDLFTEAYKINVHNAYKSKYQSK